MVLQKCFKVKQNRQNNQYKGTEKITNRKLLWRNIAKRRNKWIGNIIRYGGLLKLIIKEIIEEKNYRERLRLKIFNR